MLILDPENFDNEMGLDWMGSKINQILNQIELDIWFARRPSKAKNNPQMQGYGMKTGQLIHQIEGFYINKQ